MLFRVAMMIRILILLAVWIALQLYTHRALVAAARVAGLHAGAAWIATSLFTTLPLLAMLLYRREIIGIESPFQWVGQIATGLWSVIFVVTVLRDLVRLVAMATRPFNEGAAPGIMRAADLVAAGGVIAAVILTIGGLMVAWRPVIVEQEIRIATLDSRLDGLRVALLSDIHIGPLVTRSFAERVVSMTNSLQPDLIAVAGDLVDGEPHVLESHVAPLAALQAPLGVFYVTGNHEYYWDAPGWIAQVARLGWVPLVDEYRLLSHAGASLVVAGVTDLRAHDFLPEHHGDARRALAGAPGDVFTMLLSHQPQSGRGAETLGVDLQLAGHTHGGQYFPYSVIVHLFQPIVKGLHLRDTMSIYVTPGTGFWGPPNRLGRRGRVTLLTLRAG